MATIVIVTYRVKNVLMMYADIANASVQMDLSKRFCKKCNHRCHANKECDRCKTEAKHGNGNGCGICECPDCLPNKPVTPGIRGQVA